MNIGGKNSSGGMPSIIALPREGALFFSGNAYEKGMAKISNCAIDCFSRLGIWRLKPCCFDWKIVCCGKASRCDANGTKLRLEVLVSFFNCYCAPRRTRKTTIPTICGWCAVCSVRVAREKISAPDDLSACFYSLGGPVVHETWRGRQTAKLLENS